MLESVSHPTKSDVAKQDNPPVGNLTEECKKKKRSESSEIAEAFNTEMIEYYQMMNEASIKIDYYSILGKEEKVQEASDNFNKGLSLLLLESKDNVKKKSTLQDKLSEHDARKNDKFIEKYADRALNSNVTGLSVKVRYYITEEEHKRYISNFSRHAQEVLKFHKNNPGMPADKANPKLIVIMNKYDSERDKLTKEIYNGTGVTIKVTPALVREAVAFLKEYNKRMMKLNDEIAEYSTKDARAKFKQYDAAMKTYYTIKSYEQTNDSKILGFRRVAYSKIVKSAANYNPRKLKESMEIINMIDEEFDNLEYFGESNLLSYDEYDEI